MFTGNAPIAKDVELAKVAISWDDQVPSKYRNLFSPDNDPTRFQGTEKQLADIRYAMKRYENQEAEPFEDKRFYDARYRLQFVEVDE